MPQHVAATDGDLRWGLCGVGRPRHNGVLSTFPGVPHGADNIRSFVRGGIDLAREIMGGNELGRDKTKRVLANSVHSERALRSRMWRSGINSLAQRRRGAEMKDL